MSKPSTQLLIIDPQNDFCDLPDNWIPAPTQSSPCAAPVLPVTGAHQDMLRLSAWIEANSASLAQITVTLDSHQSYDIAHPAFWQKRNDGDGAAVNPFTQITAAQVRAGDFAPRNSAELERTLAYLDQLEAQGSYTLMVWPMHCEIGSWGHGVHAAVLRAYRQWEESQLRAAHHVFKGMNPWTEHYSAIRAEVPDAQDPETGLNTALLTRLRASDVLVIAGEASSHCVRATTEHIVENWGTADFSRIVLLTDCMSPVGGFESAHSDFLLRMQAIGVRCETSASFGL